MKYTNNDIILYAAVLTYQGMEDFEGAEEFFNILEQAGMNPSYNYTIEEFNNIIASLSRGEQ